MKKNLSTFVEKSKFQIFLKRLSILYNCKLFFDYPKKSKILFYDPFVSNIYFDIFKKLRFQTLDTRLKNIYFIIVLRAIYRKFKKKEFIIKRKLYHRIYKRK